jgi:hypothetical protein
MRLAVLLVVFVAFTAWSLTVVAGQGFASLLSLVGREPWAAQLLVDLCLALVVAWSWLRHDARTRGITAWPYQVATVAVGSVAVLAYLIHRELAGRRLPAARVRT